MREVIAKINGQSVNFVIDTGSSGMIITKQEYLKLNKNKENSLKNTDVSLTPYGSSDTLKVIGKFKAIIEYQDKQIRETIYVVNTPERQKECSLLSKTVAESLGIITSNINKGLACEAAIAESAGPKCVDQLESPILGSKVQGGEGGVV